MNSNSLKIKQLFLLSLKIKVLQSTHFLIDHCCHLTNIEKECHLMVQYEYNTLTSKV
jgi:hypothetical protein